MAKKYAATGVQTTNTTTAKTMLTIIAAAGVRIGVYDVIMGADGTPADNALRFLAQKFTAAGTSAGSPPTPVPLDNADIAAIATCGWDHSAEPTYTANTVFWDIAINQRATFRWVAAPDGELKGPATAANGIGLASLSPAYTGRTRVSAHWYE